MRHLKRSPSHRTPLFDRLIDLEPRVLTEVRPARTLTAEELRRSIALELQRLCNTRSTASVDEIEALGYTVLNYGIPDLSRFNPKSERDRDRLAVLFTRAVEAFEPRLRSPRVEIIKDPERPMRWSAIVRGAYKMDDLWEPVSFPLTREDSGSAFVVETESR